LCSAGISAAQESAVKGNLGGTIFDKTGGVVLGAKVTLTSPTGVRTTESDDRGEFLFNLLIPGAYSVKVEKQGFRTLELKGIEVMTGRTNSVHLTLEAGAITEVVEVSASAIAVDTSSTSIGANLPDTFYQQIPVGRNVSGIFYLSPGVVSGGGSGISNPSISGGSGLENLYVADGVNITDSSYGGLGTFSRIYGSLGTGINLSFVKEVQIKTGGYEPQYGQATGGIVQIVTKSGGSEYHGAIAGYFFPQSFEATRLQPDDFGRKNLFGKVLHGQSYEASGELGGYIPHFRDRFFFFGSVNPTYASDFVLAPPNSGLFSHGQFHRRTNTLAYSGKLTYKLNDHHQLEASVFGDPAHTSTAPRRTLVTDNSSSFSKFEYGTRSVVGRYNGTFSSTWVFNASFSYATNEFKESGFQNIYQIVDRTQAFGLPGQRGVFTPQGLGFFEPSNARRYGATVDTSKEYRFAGKHSFSIGYHYDRPFYDDGRERSGPRFPIPATNASGTSLTALGVPASAIGVPANATFSLRIDDTVNTSTGVATARSGGCTLCPYLKVPGITGPGPNGMVHVYLRQDRGEFGPSPVQTNGTYHAAYAMDSWSPNKYLTMNFGLRWEQQTMKGTSINYTYVDNWSPRIGAVVDPWGNGRTKIYGNFGRYNYAIPLDMAIRSLSDELDFTGARWAPAFTTDSGGNRIAAINGNGTVNPALDAAHLLNSDRRHPDGIRHLHAVHDGH